MKRKYILLICVLAIYLVACGNNVEITNQETYHNSKSEIRRDNEIIDKAVQAGLSEVENIVTHEKTDGEVTWEWLIKPGEYENINLINENYICVHDGAGEIVLLNGNKEVILEGNYVNILGAGNGVARVLDEEGYYSFINSDGKKISTEEYQDAHDFQGDLAWVKQNDKWGVINSEGELVIGYQYNNVLDGFQNGLAAVEEDGSWVFIDSKGKMVFQEKYEKVHNFSEGYAAVRKNGLWGFINEEGNLVIDFEYDEVGDFSEKKAAVMKVSNGCRNWAYINDNNEIVIDYKLYDSADGRIEVVGKFQDGYALVTKGLYCLINETGEVILGEDSFFLTGGSIYNSELGLIVAYNYVDDGMTQKKYGLIDIYGEEKVEFQFEHISTIQGNLAVVLYEQDGEKKVGVIKIVRV